MSGGAEGLIDHLLFKIALSNTEGLDVRAFVETVTDYHASSEPVNEAPTQEDEDVFLSANPPHSTFSVDAQYLETAWDWISKHPDTSIRSVKSNPFPDGEAVATDQTSNVQGTPLLSTQPPDHPSNAHTVYTLESEHAVFYRAHADSRIYTTTQDRIWHAVADHGIDWKRLPTREFQCLCVIAAHGPAGILQPDVTRITGQDKRSVPKRTDLLHEKGYIIKEACLGGGVKTSLLRLKKLVLKSQDPTHFEVDTGIGRIQRPEGSLALIRSEQWFDDIVHHLRQNNNLMVAGDLRIALGITNNRILVRTLNRCLRRLVHCGLISRVRARNEGAGSAGQMIEATPEVEPGAEEPLGPGGETASSERWIRCLKLLREPKDSDRAAFMASNRRTFLKTIAHGGDVDNGEDEGEDDDADADLDEDLLDAVDQLKGLDDARIAPQWTPDQHYSQFLFQLIDSKGIDGISSMELGDVAYGRFYRRPFDEVMGKLTDLFPLSQPDNLKHLAVIRDTACIGSNTHYIYRTFNNFSKAVEQGKASWEYVYAAHGLKHNDTNAQNTDEHGFPRQIQSHFLGRGGTSSVAHCAKSAEGAKATAIARSNTFTRPLKASKIAKIAKDAIEANDAPPSTPRPRGRPPKKKAKLTEDNLDSSNEPTKVSITPRPDYAKRTAKEMEEWTERTRKLAEGKVLQEIQAIIRVKEAEEQKKVQEQVKAPRKRGRPRKSDKQAQETSSLPETTSASTASTLVQQADISSPHVAGNTPDASHNVAGGTTDATPSKSKKRKRATPAPAPALPEERVHEVQRLIMARNTPGVYINPPGSIVMKLSNFVSHGRPRNSLIAVFKSDKLHESSWFIPDTVRPPVRQPRMVKSRPGRSVTPNLANELSVDERADGDLNQQGPIELMLPSDADGVSSQRDDDLPSASFAATLEDSEPASQVPASSITLVPATIEQDEPSGQINALSPTPVDAPTEQIKSITDNYRTSFVAESIPKQAPNKSAEMETVESTAAAEHAVQKKDDRMITDVNEAQHDKGGAIPEEDMPVEDVPAEDMPAEDTPAEGMPAKDMQTEVNVPERGPAASQNIDVEMIDDVVLSPSRHSNSHGRDAASQSIGMWNMARILPIERGKRPTPKKVGLRRSGGIINHQRSQLILDIIRSCGGVFPGDRELYYAFASEWERQYKNRPDPMTVERTARTLLETNQLKRITFDFKGRNNVQVTRHVLFEPTIDPLGPAVKALQSKISKIHPASYIPDHLFLAPDLQHRIRNQNKLQTLAMQGKTEDERRPIEIAEQYEQHTSQTVTRPYKKVKLGMTEETLAKKDAVLRRRRQVGERREQRYLRALKRKGNEAQESEEEEVEEEEIDAAKAELRRTFQISSYDHEPAEARERGPGRKLSRLIRLVPKPKPARTAIPLASLDAIRKRRKSVTEKAALAGGQFGSSHPYTAGSRFVFDHEGPHTFDPAYDQFEALSLTDPTQRLLESSGTFSTDATILCSARRTLWQAGPTLVDDWLLPSSLEEIKHRVYLGHQAPPIASKSTDAEFAQFEDEVNLVEQWEVDHTKTAFFAGDHASSNLRMINHTSPRTFVEPEAYRVQWPEDAKKASKSPAPETFQEPDPYRVSRLPTVKQGSGTPIVLSQPRYGDMFIPMVQQSYSDVLDHAFRDAMGAIAGVHTVYKFAPPSVYPMPGTQPIMPAQPLVAQPFTSQPWLAPTSTAQTSIEQPALVTSTVELEPAKQQRKKTKSVAPPKDILRKKTLKRAPHITVPRAARNGIFVLRPEDDQRLFMTIAVVRTLTGGLCQNSQYSINWGLVHQCLHYKFDARACRQRWSTIRSKHKATVDKLQNEFRKIFIEAYESGELPPMDLDEPAAIDWAALVDWAEEHIEAEDTDTLTFPGHREGFDQIFDVRPPRDVYEVDRDDFYDKLNTVSKRDEMANSYGLVAPLPDAKDMRSEDPLELTRSWVRANVMTAQDRYDHEAAHSQLSKLGDDFVTVAVEELLGQKIIRVENKGRAQPGRNYTMTDVLASSLRRPWDVTTFQEAAEYKLYLDTEFQSSGKIVVDPLAKNSHMLALMNMVSNGRAKIVPMLPPIDHDVDAPWPKLSKWGFTDGNYKTVHMDKSRLDFGLELHPTDRYVYGNPLGELAIPLSRQCKEEQLARLPMWVDVNGEFMDGWWEAALVSIMYLLCMRPGVTAEGIEKSHKGTIRAWEISLMLEWAEKVGVARKMDHAVEPGWTTAEWFWLALAGSPISG